MATRCHRCRREAGAERPSPRDTCNGCGAWLRCCRNCAFYAPGVANDCREPNAERVVDKEAANFCDWFRAATEQVAASPAADPAAARARIDALFRKT